MAGTTAWRSALALALATAAGGLASCAAPAPAVNDREIRTPSDQTDAERRARVRLELAGLYLGRGQNDTALDEVTQRAGKKGAARKQDHRQRQHP